MNCKASISVPQNKDFGRLDFLCDLQGVAVAKKSNIVILSLLQKGEKSTL